MAITKRSIVVTGVTIYDLTPNVAVAPFTGWTGTEFTNGNRASRRSDQSQSTSGGARSPNRLCASRPCGMAERLGGLKLIISSYFVGCWNGRSLQLFRLAGSQQIGGRSTPIRRTRSGCCAPAAGGHPTAAPPSIVMKARRLFIRSPYRRAARDRPAPHDLALLQFGG